jgi:signal transduction histidine kinase
MKHNFDFRSIKIVRDYQPVPEVPCESSQIQQVTLSLLKNAAQALGTKQENPEISVRILQKNGNVCLQVADNGDGMDEVTCRRIFEPFYTTKDVGQGTGLGLSVAYFLITENHKGSLTVNSKPGEGSCFSVSLPIKRAIGVQS